MTRAAHHPTAEEVYHAVRSAIPKISLATVYKALEALVATGMAAKLTAGAGPATPAPVTTPAATSTITSVVCGPGAVHDLPTRFDPGLIDKLDPQLLDISAAKGSR